MLSLDNKEGETMQELKAKIEEAVAEFKEKV